MSKVSLVYMTPDPISIIAYASRFSTATQEVNLTEQMTDYDKNLALVKKIMERNHLGCIEFADAIFEIECSRACANQIVRHRLFSYVQKSQRYCSESDFDYVMPPKLIEGLQIMKNWKEAKDNNIYKEIDMDEVQKFNNLMDLYGDIMERIQAVYNELVLKGLRKEDARFVLPNACMTKLVMKGNFRNWYQFLELRLAKNAQWEIRKIAENIRDILIEKCPIVFNKLKP